MAKKQARRTDGALVVCGGGVGLAAAEKLGGDQRAVLEKLVSGKAVAETAREAGVGRATIYRWLKTDATFQAAYNEWHADMKESCRSRLLMLTDKAAVAVERAMENGDAKTALALLKGLGFMRPTADGPTDPKEIETRRQQDQERRRIDLERESAKLIIAELDAGVGK